MSNYFSFGLNPQDVMSIVQNANLQAAYDSSQTAFMTSSIFNTPMPTLPQLPAGFDMNMSLSTPAWMQNLGSAVAQYDFSGMQQYSNPFAGASYGTITDENGEILTMTEYATKHGYEETMTDGVYKKGGKYYRYNYGLKRFTEVSKSELQQIKNNERDAKNAAKAEEYKAKLKANKSKTAGEAQAIAADISDSIDRWGTKDNKLKNTVSKINADNVIEVWDQWQANHEVDFGNEGGLMASIADDTSGKDLKKYELAIKNALIARAEALGLTTDADQFRAHDNSDYSTYDVIIEAIKNKERE